jgi:hypothetical protein
MGTEYDINIDPIINDITNVLRTSLDKILHDFSKKHRVYEETYNHLIQLHTVIGRASGINKISHDLELETRLLEKLSSVEEKLSSFVDDKLTSFQSGAFEKLLRKIDAMQDEIDTLKRDKTRSIPIPSESSECNITLVIEEKLGVGPEIIHGALLDTESDSEEEVKKDDEESDEDEDEDEVKKDEEESDDSKEEEKKEEDESKEESDEESKEEEEEEEDESEEEESDKEESKDEKEEGSDEEEEYYEIEIKNVSYCTNDEVNGFIYELDTDGDIGKKVGYFKDSQPFFY